MLINRWTETEPAEKLSFLTRSNGSELKHSLKPRQLEHVTNIGANVEQLDRNPPGSSLTVEADQLVQTLAGNSLDLRHIHNQG